MGLFSTLTDKNVDFKAIPWMFDKMMSIHMWIVKNATWNEQKSYEMMVAYDENRYEERYKEKKTLEEQQEKFARWKSYIEEGDEEFLGVHKRGVFTITCDKLRELKSIMRQISVIYRSISRCQNGKVAQRDFRKLVDEKLPNYYLEQPMYGGRKHNRENKEVSYMLDVEEMLGFLNDFLTKAEKSNQTEFYYIAMWD